MKDLKKLINTPFSSVKTIHFTGIGGIGMSGLAELFATLGYDIQGSDLKENNSIKHLRKKGIKVIIGQEASNIKDVDIIVISSAIKDDNPEYKEAIEQGIPIFKRSKMLAELMRFKWGIAVSGTHGKTTTTSLLSQILYHSKFDPTAIIGGIVNSWGQNSRFGASSWLVAEADESDGSFLELPAIISIVTNIEAEHMDYYKSYDNLKDKFINFIHNIPFFGFAVMCIDNKGVRDILPFVKKRNVITYGISPQADYRITNIRYISYGSYFDVHCNIKGKEKIIKEIYLPMNGEHNVLNATATIAVADNINIDIDVIKEAICYFEGVKRRFTPLGDYKDTKFIDDYAHHPTEITVVIDAAKSMIDDYKQIISIVQPHRYSRLKEHFEDYCQCFNKSDFVFVLDVYSAGEQELEDYNAKKLVQGIKSHGHKNVIYVPSKSQLKDLILEKKEQNSIAMAIFMGAGDITNIAQNIFEEITNH